MDLKLHKVEIPNDNCSLQISGSKSESNRWLILQALYDDLLIKNLSDSDDSRHLDAVLKSNESILDIGHAGTAMRFGTAYFATQENKEITLTGSDRMKQRPIGILVDALNNLGAQVSYVEEKGYPPLRIKGSKISGGKLSIDGSVSSQFLSAILLVAPRFENGLELHVVGELTSRPYLDMTLNIIKQLGVEVRTREENGDFIIHVATLEKSSINTAVVESDWSSAGYWYSWVALQDVGYEMELAAFNEHSLQGDSALATFYLPLGVETYYQKNKIKLVKSKVNLPSTVELDLTKEPDQAQTIFATCLGLGIDAILTGLHTLKIKETDRIEAMKVVGSRFRESEIITTNNSIHLHFEKNTAFNKDVIVDTFQDHRMAMAFAPLVMKTSMIIKDAMVVTKSYKTYYEDLKKVNVSITEI